MYNKKSKASAILVIVAAVLLIGLMILLPFTQYKAEEGGDLGTGIAAVFIVLFSLFGYAIVYAGAIPFVIVAFVFGIKMLKQQSRKKLISYNVRMLITTCVLLPVLAVGLIGSSGMVSQSTLGLFPIIFTAIVVVAYLACLIAQIATIAVLKNTPEEIESV